MTINKFQGKTEEEAKQKARDELGPTAVIMNVKEIRPKGLFGAFKNSVYEVTAAVEDDYGNGPARPSTYSGVAPTAQDTTNPGASRFNAVVDDSVNLQEVFKEINDIRLKASQSTTTVPQTRTIPYDRPTPRPSSMSPKMTGAMSQPNIPSSVLASEPATASQATPQQTPVMTAEATKPSAPAPSPVIHASNVAPAPKPSPKPSVKSEEPKNNQSFVKILYNTLLNNEVQEKYINQVLEDMDKLLATSNSLENLISSVYQKMVLKLGNPEPIVVTGKKAQVVFFIGPTGVGKTTTIAKIASSLKLEQSKNVGFITADIFRMAAADQLHTYADILQCPMEVIYAPRELNDAIKKLTRENPELDVILVDTIGFSHKNAKQKEDTKLLLESIDETYDYATYLVLSATTKYRDLKDITDSYSQFADFKLIFTKLDETACLGNIYNIKLRTNAPLSYVTTGQNVPDDIEVVNNQSLVRQLLGGN